MSQFNVSASVIAKFSDKLHEQYQEKGGKIRPHIYCETDVIGGTFEMPTGSIGFAKDAPATGSDAETMGGATGMAKITLKDKQASDYSQIFKQDTISFSAQEHLVKKVAMALGRTEDQTACDALKAGTYIDGKNSVSVVEAGVATNLTVAKLIDASILLDDNNVDEEGRFIVAPVKAKRALLNSTAVTSVDYADVKALVNGTVSSFMNFTFIWIGDTTDSETGDLYGCDNNGTDLRTCYAFHSEALGMAIGTLDKQVTIDYISQKFAHFVGAPLRVGSAIRDTDGIIQIHINTAKDATANTAPIVNVTNTTVTEDTAIVVANAEDLDGTIDSSTLSAENGTVAISAGGDITYTPTTGFTGDDIITVSITDDDGATSTVTFEVTVS